MTWFEQLRHVFAKDVRTQRWLLLAFVVMLGISAATTLRVNRGDDLASAATAVPSITTFDAAAPDIVFESGDFSTTMTLEQPVGTSWLDFLIPSLIVLMCALIVLADHPTHARAHWTSLPYNRTAILGAKLALTLVLVAAIAFARSTPLVVLQLPFAQLLPRLGESALSMLMLCLVALLLASASRDLRAVLMMVVLVYVVSYASGFLIAIRSDAWRVPAAVGAISQLAVLLASVWWLYQVYRTRPRASVVGATSFLLAALMFVPAKLRMLAPYDELVEQTQALPNLTISSRLEAQRSSTGDSLALLWHLRTSGIPTTVRARQQGRSQYANSAEPECHGIRLGLSMPLFGILREPSLPIGSAITWPAGAPHVVDSLSFSRLAWSGFANTAEARCASSGWSVQLELSEPAVFAELPLRAGERVTHSGQRVAISETSRGGSSRIASLVTLAVSPSTLCDFDSPTFVLVNRVTREAVSLTLVAQQKGFDAQLCRNRYLLALADSTGRETTWQSLGKRTTSDVARWLQDARIVVIEWQHRGNVSITPRAIEETQ